MEPLFYAEFSDWLETVCGYVGDSDGSNTVYLNKDVFVLLDSLDNTFYAFKTASGDSYTTAHVGRVSCVKKNDRFVMG